MGGSINNTMDKYILINYLEECDEEEVLIADSEGNGVDFDFEHLEEAFDGFDTAYPAAVMLKPKKV